MKAYTATGRRKTSVAQVRLITPGKGNVQINKKPLNEYFPVEVWRHDALRPLELTHSQDKFDVQVTVRGGGKNGQTGAIQLGVARALVEYDQEFKTTLREYDMMTRDPRMVERKKYGQKKARKRFQFSKR